MHRGAFLLGAAACALLLPGCLGQTAILLKVTGSMEQLGTFDLLTVIVTQPETPDLPWVHDIPITALPYEVALEPGAIVDLGDVGITVIGRTSDRVDVARGSIGTTIEDHKVTRITLPLQKVGCNDDPFEPAEMATGGATLDPKDPSAAFTLCADDPQDVIRVFAPAGYIVSFRVSDVDVPGALSGELICTSMGMPLDSAGPAELAPGIALATNYPLLADATCSLRVSRATLDAERSTFHYTLSPYVGPNLPCTVDGSNTTTFSLAPGDDDTVSAGFAACPTGDMWQVTVPPGTIFGLEVLPATEDPSFFTVDVSCPDAPSAHSYYGFAFARSGPLGRGGADETCTAFITGPEDAVFDLRAWAGDYTGCVDDFYEAAEGPGMRLDLDQVNYGPPLTICRGFDGTVGYESDSFQVNVPPGTTQICVNVIPDLIFDQFMSPGYESNLTLFIAGDSFAGNEFGYSDLTQWSTGACISGLIDPVSGSPGPLASAVATVDVDCGYDLSGADMGCAQVYQIYYDLYIGF
jgi:hypothetical protein